MSRRRIGAFVLLLMVAALLTGCLPQARHETIIIPDSEEHIPAGDKNERFEVKTIYRIMDKNTDFGTPLGWIDRSALLGLFGEQTLSPSLDRVDYPYESHLKLQNADVSAYPLTLSPSGQTVAFLAQMDDGTYGMKLVSLADQQETLVGRIPNDQIRSIQFGWSNNGRYLIYIFRDGANGAVQIHVYDTTGKSMKGYTAAGWKPKDTIISVHIADDAQSAAIVKETDRLSNVLFGTWNGNEFTAQYEHPVSRNSTVEWIHNDQIAFIGAEDTLYAYDRRNSALSILVEQTDLFRLSPDRKSIAYLQGKDTVYTASLYGNNVLNKTQIFKGIFPSKMSFSPDNGKLLLTGWKTYAQEQTRPSPVVQPGNQHLVIEFK